MFGYVTPLVEELRVKEHNFYKSVYCGLCKCMGKRVCSESRMTLSYDMVFLALLRFALTDEKLEFRTGRCLAQPFKKKVILKPNKSLEYCAGAGALLAYHNLADDVRDKKGFSLIKAKILLFMARRMRKKAGMPELDRIIELDLEELEQSENSNDTTPDSAASKFGCLLSSIFVYGLPDGANKRIAEQMGYHIGKWIYAADAADDFGEDKKSGEFNPLSDIDKDTIRCSMNLELGEASSAAELISYTDTGIKNIIENIIYLGMPSKMEKILSKYPEVKSSPYIERNGNK